MKQQRVPFCDGCGKVRDELASGEDAPRWVELREFQMVYGFKPEDLVMAHTYCPECEECVKAGTHTSGPPGSATR